MTGEQLGEGAGDDGCVCHPTYVQLKGEHEDA